jgi:tetratricopeptide (TPR) repeat protein
MGALLALNFWRKNSILFCAGLLLAMLAKSSWVLLPWALLLWSWPNPPPASDRRRERACLMIAVLLSLGVAAMTYLGHKTFEARATFEEALRAWQNTSLASGERHSLSQVLSALSFYAGRWLIPVGMAPFFDLDQIQFVFTDGLGALAFLLLIALLWRGKNSRTVLWWCLASLMVLLPVSGVVPFGFKQAYAARYLYFPLPFMLFFLLDGLATLTPPSGQRILVAFSAVAIVLLAVTTAHYRESYRDAGHFHQAIVERFPQSAIGHNGLGKWYASAGQKDMALQHFTQAVAANPNYLQANYNLGVFYLQQDNCAQAMPWLSKALTLNPNLDAAKKAHAHCQAKVKIDPDANSR